LTAPNKELVFVFDMAGVLVQWDADVLYDPIFQESGKDKELFFDQILGEDIQTAISSGQPISNLLDGLVLKFPDWQKEIRAYWDRWEEMIVGAIEGTVSVVEELKERGHRVYVLGNWGREELDRARPNFEFLELFDDILLSGDCGILKPNPQIFEIAEQRFTLTPENTVFVDDRAENVQAAIDKGWNGIVFENPRQLYLVLMDYGIL
jgi:2-haloacid dehalogenase